MKPMLDFFRTMLLMPKPWLLWIGLLILANAVAPIFWITRLEAQVVIAAISVGAVVQIVIFNSKGFVRLLGMGHIVAWVPMLPWLWSRIAQAPADGAFRTWMLVVIVLNVLSLLIDFTDVFRYFRGEREPMLKLSGAA